MSIPSVVPPSGSPANQPNVGFIPSGVSLDYNSLFSNLLDFSWKGVSFPVIEFYTILRQDLAVHKFADRDGAHIEGTGRSPYEIGAMIPFYNGLTPGPNEKWKVPLYPDGWMAFWGAAHDGSSDILSHPQLGPIKCKLASLRTVWRGERRSGVIVEAVWLETDDSSLDAIASTFPQSPMANLAQWAADADNGAIPSNIPGVPQLPTFPQTLSSFLQGVRAAFDSVTMLQRSFAGQLDAIKYQANQLETSITTAFGGGGASNANTSLYWPVARACEGVKSAVDDVQATLLAQSRKNVKLYTTQRDLTLAAISCVIPARLDDLFVLNRRLVGQSIIPSGTVIRYYPL